MPFAISSTGCSTDRALSRIVAAACLWVAAPAALYAGVSRIAVFPPIDRTGRSAPVEQIQTALELSLQDGGFAPLPRAELESFIRGHRVRHVGGIAGGTAGAIGVETGVDAVLLSSVDDWEILDPPRFALTSRLVAASPGAQVLWMETSAHHGLEHPGAFGLGIVTSIDLLIQRATDGISGSLAAFVLQGRTQDEARVPGRFRPGSFAVDPAWATAAVSGRQLRAAVLPFVANTEWRDAGELVASQLVRWLVSTGEFEVLESGVVREALLEARVIQEDGPSLPQVDALRALLDLDLIVSGRVTDYEAMGSSPGSPFLGFSARAIDVRTRQVVWSSFSFGRGDDRVGLFGAARVRSSITLTSELVRGAVKALEAELRSRRPSQGVAIEAESHP